MTTPRDRWLSRRCGWVQREYGHEGGQAGAAAAGIRAFHCSMMQPAADAMAGRWPSRPCRPNAVVPTCWPRSNATPQVGELLVAQVTGRVRWRSPWPGWRSGRYIR